MRVLLIEDEKRIASFVQRGLKEKKFIVDVAADGEEGLYLAENCPYDCILLDIMLPKKDGFQICDELRKKKIATPILMLTARNAVQDRVSGLNKGADDYLSKPFSFDELLARVRALTRRRREEKDNILRIDDLELNMLNHEVQRTGKRLSLTTKEYMVLEYLMLHAGQLVTRTMISEHVWNEDFNSFSNVIDVHIQHLRSKVDNGHKRKLIHTMRGSGYIIKGKNAP